MIALMHDLNASFSPCLKNASQISSRMVLKFWRRQKNNKSAKNVRNRRANNANGDKLPVPVSLEYTAPISEVQQSQPRVKPLLYLKYIFVEEAGNSSLWLKLFHAYYFLVLPEKCDNK